MNAISTFRLSAIAVLLPLLGACNSVPSPQPVGMANPASAYCVELGGRVEIGPQAEGAVGICHLPDGSSIEEWALFRRDHPQP